MNTLHIEGYFNDSMSLVGKIHCNGCAEALIKSVAQTPPQDMAAQVIQTAGVIMMNAWKIDEPDHVVTLIMAIFNEKDADVEIYSMFPQISEAIDSINARQKAFAASIGAPIHSQSVH